MPKPVDRPKALSEFSPKRSRKDSPNELITTPFSTPSPIDENGVSVVVATALRDRLEPTSTTSSTEESATQEPPVDGTMAEPASDPISTVESQATVYRWESLGDSVLKGPRRSELWDVVTDFNGAADQIDAPDSITTTEITESSGSIKKLNAGQINAKGLGGDEFKADTARAFLYAGPNKELQNGVFVVFNDSRPGYQHRTDSLIFVRGFSFEGGGGGEGEVATADANVIRFWPPATIAPTPEPTPA